MDHQNEIASVILEFLGRRDVQVALVCVGSVLFWYLGAFSKMSAVYKKHLERFEEGEMKRKRMQKNWGEVEDDVDDEENEQEEEGQTSGPFQRWYRSALKRLQKAYKNQAEFWLDPTWWMVICEMRQLNLAIFGLAALGNAFISFLDTYCMRLEGGVLDFARPKLEVIFKTPAGPEQEQLQSGLMDTIWNVLIRIFAIRMLTLFLSTTCHSLIVYSCGQRMQVLKRRYYRMLLIQDPLFHKKNAREVVGWAREDVEELSSVLLDQPIGILRNVTDLVSAAVTLFMMDWQSTCLNVIFKAFQYFGVFSWMEKHSAAYWYIRIDNNRELGKNVSSALNQCQAVQLAGAEEFEVRRVNKLMEDNVKAQTESQIPDLVSSSIQTLIASFESLGLVYVCLRAISQGRLSIGDFTSFQRCFGKMNFAIRGLTMPYGSGSLVALKKKLPTLKRYFDLRDRLGPVAATTGIPDDSLPKPALPTAPVPAMLSLPPKAERTNTTGLESENLSLLPDVPGRFLGEGSRSPRTGSGDSTASERATRTTQQSTRSPEDISVLPEFAPAATATDRKSKQAAAVLPARGYCKVTMPDGKAYRKVLHGSIEFCDVHFHYPVVDDPDGDSGSLDGKGDDKIKDQGTPGKKGKTKGKTKGKGKGKGKGKDAPETETTEPSNETAASPVMVLRGATFSVKAGMKVAFCGASGCGKTTIFRLLTKFYEATKGRILLDGIDLNCWEARSLRKRLGYVEQKASIFNDRTVEENLCYGMDPDSPEYPSRETIEEVCRKASIHDDILKWTKGYKALLGSTGVTPSGGQEQRLMIARAMLRNPALLLLDESTASLDPPSEAAITAAIGELMKGRTCILIAHRLSTVRNADLIVFFKDGQVAEMGTHAELRESKGFYDEYVRITEESAEPKR